MNPLIAEMDRPEIAAVDLFCGAAGLSLGLKHAGIQIRYGVDQDAACRFPFETNIGAPFLEKDVRSLTSTDVRDMFAGAKVRVLAGCAPCQPFSGYTAGKLSGSDERWQLLLEVARLTESVLPEIVTVENVPRLAQLGLWREFRERLESAGYHVAQAILDASNYGVPQSRRRLVLVASRLGIIDLPSAKGGPKPTVRAAIGSLPAIAAGEHGAVDVLHATRALTTRNLRRIRSSVPAGTWRSWPTSMKLACHRSASGKTYPSVYGRMSWDKPSPTITTQFYGFGNGRFGHPEQDRAISIREGALLQSFPPDFIFMPPGERLNFRLLGRLIGNAVPPSLACSIGSAIIDHVARSAI